MEYTVIYFNRHDRKTTCREVFASISMVSSPLQRMVCMCDSFRGRIVGGNSICVFHIDLLHNRQNSLPVRSLIYVDLLIFVCSQKIFYLINKRRHSHRTLCIRNDIRHIDNIQDCSISAELVRCRGARRFDDNIYTRGNELMFTSNAHNRVGNVYFQMPSRMRIAKNDAHTRSSTNHADKWICCATCWRSAKYVDNFCAHPLLVLNAYAMQQCTHIIRKTGDWRFTKVIVCVRYFDIECMPHRKHYIYMNVCVISG